MESILLGLAVLACPVGMGLMMFFMGKGMMGGKKKEEEPGTVEEMRLEQQRLVSQVERLERERSAGEVPAR